MTALRSLAPRLLKAIRSLSSMQAVATNHGQSIETRIAALGKLFSQLADIDTVQKTDSLSARFNSELNYAKSQQVQAQQTMSGRPATACGPRLSTSGSGSTRTRPMASPRPVAVSNGWRFHNHPRLSLK